MKPREIKLALNGVSKQSGLTATGHLLVAEGHLVKAKEMLLQKHLPIQLYSIGMVVRDITEKTRRMLGLLKQQEEE